jgi:hypothetical protein
MLTLLPYQNPRVTKVQEARNDQRAPVDLPSITYLTLAVGMVINLFAANAAKQETEGGDGNLQKELADSADEEAIGLCRRHASGLGSRPSSGPQQRPRSTSPRSPKARDRVRP